VWPSMQKNVWLAIARRLYGAATNTGICRDVRV